VVSFATGRTDLGGTNSLASIASGWDKHYKRRMILSPQPLAGTTNYLTPMALASIEEAIADIRAGRMVIVVDDEDRENEGDLVCAAEKVTPDIINFMAKYGRGLICLSLTEERCDELDLPLQAVSYTHLTLPTTPYV